MDAVADVTVDSQERLWGDFITQFDDVVDELVVRWDFAHFFFGAEDIYGKDRGAVIAGGFGSIFAFHTNDNSSREYITRRFGQNIMEYEYHNLSRNTMISREREGNTVEEWDQLNLGVGQAVIGLGYHPPFLFQFDQYGKQAGA